MDDYLSLLPHMPPMRLLEEVLELVPGERCTARRVARPDDFYFQGHFPGNPVVPACILLELLAQTGGLAAGSTIESRQRRSSSVSPRSVRASFRRPRVPARCSRRQRASSDSSARCSRWTERSPPTVSWSRRGGVTLARVAE